jgi:hypothetical protein
MLVPGSSRRLDQDRHILVASTSPVPSSWAQPHCFSGKQIENLIKVSLRAEPYRAVLGYAKARYRMFPMLVGGKHAGCERNQRAYN